MFYTIDKRVNVFAEITNAEHGGEGWGLGTCLWSPKGNSWKEMRQVKPGDVVIHLVKEKANSPRLFKGISIISSFCKERMDEPPLPDKWKGRAPYYRVELTNYYTFTERILVKEFFQIFSDELMKLYSRQSLFADDLRLVQRYLCEVTSEVYEVIEELFDSYKLRYNPVVDISNQITNNITDNNNRVTTYIINRYIRDTKLTNNLKHMYSHKCQICGKGILLPNGNSYVEGHHIRPLGGDHQGPDVEGNIIILCPNHHAEFDNGSIALNPNTLIIEHINKDDKYYNKKIILNHELNKEYLSYHYEMIFNK